MNYRYAPALVFAILLLMFFGLSAEAQTPKTPAATATPAAKTAATTPAKTPAQIAQEKAEAEKAKRALLDAPFDQSLFFSPQDLIAISKAQKGAVSEGGGTYNGAPIPQKRTIALSGIIYRGPNDWLIWLNGQKLVPGHLLKEIVDIQVHETSVHLKWFDIGLNGVIDLTIHPHETYDIVTGIMLPGTG